MTVRPRPGDLERAAAPHVPEHSGTFVGSFRSFEICDVCGMVWPSRIHDVPEVSA